MEGFTVLQACRFTNCTAHQLRYWDQIGLVRPSIQSTGGRLVLIEYRGEDPKVPIRPEHKMTVKQVREELEPEGFRFDEAIEILPQQHILVFRK